MGAASGRLSVLTGSSPFLQALAPIHSHRSGSIVSIRRHPFDPHPSPANCDGPRTCSQEMAASWPRSSETRIESGPVGTFQRPNTPCVRSVDSESRSEPNSSTSSAVSAVEAFHRTVPLEDLDAILQSRRSTRRRASTAVTPARGARSTAGRARRRRRTHSASSGTTRTKTETR